VEPVDGVAHHVRGDSRLFRNRQIGSASARDEHGADARRRGSLSQRNDSRLVVVLAGGCNSANGLEGLTSGTGDEERLSSRNDAPGDGGYLSRSVSHSQND